MKKTLLLLVSFTIVALCGSELGPVKASAAARGQNNGSKKVAVWDTLSLYQVNFLPADSVRIADSLAAALGLTSTVTSRHSLTDGFYLGDTVTVTGVVMADPGISINGANQFSAGNIDMYIQSADSAEWGGMNIFGSSTTASSIGLSSVDTGYIVVLTGVVTKYGTDIMGNFELKPINQTIGVNDVIDRPAPVELKLGDLVTGDISSGGQMHFNPGVKYKGSYVVIRNLTVKTSSQNTSTGQWSWTVADSAGNTISVYDPSKYFTGRSWGVTPKFVAPAPGSKLKYLRGILATFASYGYEIVPLYPGDMQIDAYTPSITPTVAGFSARRSAAFPKPTDDVTVEVIAKDLDPSASSTAVDSADVYYSVNDSPYVWAGMTAVDASDTLWSGTIPHQVDGSLVTYFFKAWQHDSLNNVLSSIAPDTARVPLFYYVKANGYSIKDIQYTPFKDGVSGVVNLPVQVSGVVQADSTDYPAEADPRSGAIKTPYAYVQDAAAPWSGIMLYDSKANQLRRGELVTLLGTVSEYNNMTELTVDSIVSIALPPGPLYPPVKIKTGDIAQRYNGDTLAERWEGVLVEYDSVTITNNDPDGPSYSITGANGSFREYFVNDGSGDTRVDDDGSNTYSVDPHDTSLGYTILPQGAWIGSLVGEIKYQNSEYKLEPRKNDDFSEVTAVKKENNPVPSSFALEQNFPNPFNPTTMIRYSIPKSGMVTLKIYNILGQEVATIVNGHQTAGTYTASFNASRLASGVYFYRLSVGNFNNVKKMLLLK